MKYITLCLLVIVGKWAYGTHYRSGEITYRITGINQIEATVITYAKWSSPSNLADRDTVSIQWGDGNTSVLFRSNGPDVEFVCDDVKKNVYIGTHIYSALAPNGFYILSFFDQNRMANINNISNGNSVEVPFYLEDTIFLNNMEGMLNNSPLLLNPICEYANINDTFTFNPVAYDTDGDSLEFQLITPLMSAAQHVPLYLLPDTYCENLAQSSSFILDTKTGQLTWSTPCVSGFFSYAFVVREYRNGILLGTIMRDQQIIVVDVNNDSPIISGGYDTIINPGDSIEFPFFASDPQNGQADTLTMLGGAFLLGDGAPLFQSTAGNPATGTFKWRPGTGAVRKHAYIFSAKAKDNYKLDANTQANLSKYQSFRIWVSDTSSSTVVNDMLPDSYMAAIFPNPSTDHWKLNASTELIGSSFEISDATGKIIYQSKIEHTHSDIQLNAAMGLYILQFHRPKGLLRTSLSGYSFLALFGLLFYNFLCNNLAVFA